MIASSQTARPLHDRDVAENLQTPWSKRRSAIHQRSDAAAKAAPFTLYNTLTSFHGNHGPDSNDPVEL